MNWRPLNEIDGLLPHQRASGGHTPSLAKATIKIIIVPIDFCAVRCKFHRRVSFGLTRLRQYYDRHCKCEL